MDSQTVISQKIFFSSLSVKTKNKIKMVAIFQILYYIIFGSMFLMSLFIIFHIVFYSYSTASKLTMLAIFVPVAGVLLFTNFILFFQIPLGDLFLNMLP